MGSCALGKKENKIPLNKISKQLHEKEIEMLRLIYNDLSSRCKDQKITRDIFRSFFNKTSFWGDRLFKQFQQDKFGFLGVVQFINGIADIFKSSEDQKILLLFAFFSHSHGQQLNGLKFQEFVQVLYNYPKADLKAIMDDHDFLDHNIRKIVNQKQKRLGSATLNQNQEKLNTLAEYELREQTQMDGSSRSQSAYGINAVLQLMKEKSGKMTNMRLDGHEIKIKTSSINSLIRKFARSIFQKYNIDVKQGKLNCKQFKSWIKEHKNLYNNYFSGFHSDVWEYDELHGRLKYLNGNHDKKVQAKLKLKNNDVIPVVVYLLQETLILIKQKEEIPFMVINLEGLLVRQAQNYKQLEYGINIIHTQEHYQQKSLFFHSKIVQSEWLHQLRFYKGHTISQHFLIKEPIGSGKFSIVHRCEDKQTSQSYAIKIMNKKQTDPYFRNQLKLLEHESSIMQTLKGLNTIVQFKQKIQTKQKTYIITELVEGKDLNDLIHDGKEPFTQNIAKNIAKQIIVTVQAIHEKGIIHRDLKPQNIMIKGEGEKMKIKIIDFGLSVYEYNMKENEGMYADSDIQGGTPGYFAPQSIQFGIVTRKSDNFAIGGIIYFMLTETSPFFGQFVRQIFNKTIAGDLYFDKNRWDKLSVEAREVVEALTNKDHEKRITLNQILKHPWFKKNNSK